MTAERRVAARRRTAVRVGLTVIVLLSATLTATACIFDRSDYKGGGRLDKGATAGTASSSATATDTAPTDTPTSTSTTPQQDAASILDAGGGD